ncbi:MAG: nuclear transport factor 2 family protein [Gemmatimonadales bacterium]|jgi:ketosteroid isomerase-like protein|nr:nuclear transport factor 2 family protein [Gemmatimonadales bacterium]
MRHALPLAALAATLLVAAGCAPKGPAPAEMVAAAEALDKAYVDAFNRDDADALMATYWNSPDLVSIGLDGSVARGWDTVSAEWHASMDGFPQSRLELLEPQNVAVGDVVMGWGSWRITAPSDSGPPEVLEGPYTDIKALRDGRWVRVMDHASVPLP